MVSQVGCGDFEVCKFIGRGCYSFVYEVAKLKGIDKGKCYALKQFYLENESSVICVMRERKILERLALAEFQSPFLPMLLYSIWHNYSSSFILREGAGCDLFDLLCHVGHLPESNVRFYLSEIICGLEHLHSLDIVHLDIKPENILFYKDGHVFISDLDRSYDIKNGSKPTADDFTGTPLFMAPEVARGEIIDKRADIWSIGVLVAEMVAGPIRPDAQTTAQDFQRARMGTYNIRGLKKFSKPLQSFFSVCLQRNVTQRSYLEDVKKLRFLKCVDWEKVKNRSLKLPYDVSDIKHRPTKFERMPCTSTDKRVLCGAFSHKKPFTSVNVMKEESASGFEDSSSSDNALPSITSNINFTGEKLCALFSDFNFIHPSLRSVAGGENLVNGLKEVVLPPSCALDATVKCAAECPKAPSLFTRGRRRGVSIGD